MFSGLWRCLAGVYGVLRRAMVGGSGRQQRQDERQPGSGRSFVRSVVPPGRSPTLDSDRLPAFVGQGSNLQGHKMRFQFMASSSFQALPGAHRGEVADAHGATQAKLLAISLNRGSACSRYLEGNDEQVRTNAVVPRNPRVTSARIVRPSMS